MKRVVGVIICVIGVFTIAGSIILNKRSDSISIIGGADGPTAIFIAGKTGANFLTIGILCGIILIILAILLMVWKKRG